MDPYLSPLRRSLNEEPLDSDAYKVNILAGKFFLEVPDKLD